MKKNIVCLFFCLFVATFNVAVCQHTIEGFIYTEEESLPYASIVLYSSSDNTLYKASLSDSNGYFNITDISNGAYVLKVQYLGFNDYVDTLSLSAESESKLNLEKIVLKESITMLQGVEVVAKRPVIERLNNLTIMNVESASIFMGSDAFELLKKIPGIFVDVNGNISLYYKSVRVTVDNKDINLGGDELASFLKSIPFEEVFKIEINSNPTSNFDAEGAGGIINIVTKKRLQNGIHGRVSVNTCFSLNKFRTGPGISGSLSAKINKFSIIASLGVQYQPEYNTLESTEKKIVNNGVFERKINTQSGDNHWNADEGYLSPFARLEMEYAINPKSAINLSFRVNNTSKKASSQSYNRLFFNSTVPDSSFIEKYKNNANTIFYSTNINYFYLFEKGGRISIDVNYSPYRSFKNNSNREFSYFNGDFVGESYRTSTIGADFHPSFSDIFYTKVDFSQDFSPKINFKAGAKYTYVVNNSNFRQYYNGLFDSLSHNSLKYIENIAAIYASLSYQINDNHHLSVGLRGEYTFSTMFQKVLDSSYVLKPYFDIFPDLSYSVKIDDKNNLNLSYNYRISRPRYNDLDPKVNVIDEFTVNTGNIDLKPSYTHDINLTHTYKNMLFSLIGYNLTQGTTYRFKYYDEESLITINKPGNVQNLSAIYGGEQFLYSVKWWSSSTYIQFMFLFSDFTYMNKTEKSNFFKINVGTYHSFTFLKNYAAEFAINWTSGEKFGFMETRTLPNIIIGFRARFLNDNLTLGLRVSPLRNKVKITEKYPNGNVINTVLNQYNELIFVSLSYRFGNNSFSKSFRNSDIDEIKSRIKMD